ncbi:VOC family protein [Facklamia lactis]|uniref:VOC family protein n=1 Tax=Facklamia lactis TaxID=2749967 RepID=UPI0018CCA3B4|nr:VOC family protein [Facklamia lactis]MBG9980780.1 VOC family protein [Facklamia lactis]
MTLQDITQSTTQVVTSAVQINALNSQKLANFYQNTIGLTLISKSKGFYKLGTPDHKVLLELFPNTSNKKERTTGLYHMAFLLPNKNELGTILQSFIDKQIPLQGAANHGYSNAIYLADPEGNGIEIYYDKKQTEWDIRATGHIVGVTEPMDIDYVLEGANPTFDGLPIGTTMGHIHLHVSDLDETLNFYRQILGLGLKYPLGKQAYFLASSNYHHHLGINIWQGHNLPAPNINTCGLRASVWSANQIDYQTIQTKLKEFDVEYKEGDNTLTFEDNSGLTVIIEKKS